MARFLFQQTILLFGAAVLGVACADEAVVASGPANSSLKSVPTDELQGRLATMDWPPFGVVGTDNENSTEHPEAFLRELIRRESVSLEQVLRSSRNVAERLRQTRKNDDPFETDPLQDIQSDDRVREFAGTMIPNRLEVQIAIRRLQGKRDPLEITIDNSERGIKGEVRCLPVLNVHIKNVDSEKSPMYFTFGGNYRSGRLTRWRIHATDERGIPVSTRPRNFGMGGGVYSTGDLKFGAKDSVKLPVGNYLAIREPGRYQLTVMYHNEETIADASDPSILENLVYTQSEPFWIEIADGPLIEIELTRAEYNQALELLKGIGSERFVFVDGDAYADSEFLQTHVSPASRHGKLLMMKEKAVPSILRQLRNEKITPADRAFAFLLLYSIIPEMDLDPTQRDGVMPAYTCRFPGGYCRSSGDLDPTDLEPQFELARDWIAFAKRYVRVKPVAE